MKLDGKYLIFLFIVVFFQIAVADDFNGEKTEDISNSTGLLKNIEVTSVSSQIEAISDTASEIEKSGINNKKTKSDILFPSGHRVDQTGFETLSTTASPPLQNMRFGILQFYEPLKASTLEEFKVHGINLYETVDSKSLAYYSSFPATEINFLKGSGIVKWFGLIPRGGKIEKDLFNSILQNPNETFKIYVAVFPDFDEEIMRTKIQESADIIDYSPEGHFYLASSEGAKLPEILDLEFIKQIEEWKPSKITNVHGLPAVGGDVVLGIGSFTGSGVNIEFTDTGAAYSAGNYHPDLPVPSDQWDFSGSGDSIADDEIGHGTHTAGIALGRGNRNPLYKGIAPDASLISYKWVGVSDTSFGGVMTRAARHSTDVSSNSWEYGDSNGDYGTDGAGIVDRAVLGEYNKKISVIVAAGNDNNIVADPGTNKNGITVGAATLGNDGNNNYSWSSSGCTDDAEPAATVACFSNYGPINDRLKPDVMAPGYMIISSYPWYLDKCDPDGDSYYCKKIGTSMAAPYVAGIAAAIIQSQPVLKNWPEGVKAQIINSAVYIDSIPQNRQGHGHVSEFSALYNQNGVYETPLWGLDNISASGGGFKEYAFNVTAGFKEVKVTLAYSDDPGSGTTQDLDLYVYDASGAQTGLSNSSTDTVEEIKINSGAPGTWRARVQAWSTRKVNYSVVASVRMKDPALYLSDFASVSILPGSSFSLTTALGNSGYVTVGSYISLQVPSGFTLNDIDIYRNDGKIVNIPQNMLYYDPAANSYRVSAGEVVNGYNRKVVWKLTSPGAIGTYVFNGYYGAQNFAQARSSISVFINNPPDTPISLNQYKSDGTNSIPPGGSTNESVVVMKGDVSDPDGNNVQMEAEAQPVGIPFTNTPNCVSGASVPSGGTASATCSGFISRQYHWQARAKDSNGAAGGWLSAGENPETSPDFIVDTIPPNNPTSYSSSHTINVWSNDSSIDISWTGASDTGSNIAGYYYKWDQSPGTVPSIPDLFTSGTNTTSPALYDGGNWYFHVRAKDNAGNLASGAYHVGQFKIDVNPPSAPANVMPSPGGWSSKNSFSVNWTNPGDASGIAGAYYKLDTPPVHNTDGAWTTSKPITGISVSGEGSHAIYIWLKDNAGNVDYDNRSSVKLYLDSSPPAVEITSPGSNDVVKGTITINGSVSDPHILSYALSIDDRAVSYSLPYLWNTNNETETGHAIRLTATDEAGNTNTSQISIIVDRTKPIISLDAPTTSNYVYGRYGGNITVNYTYSEANPANVSIMIYNRTATLASKVITSLPGGNNTARNEKLTLSNAVSDGLYNVSVNIKDKADNQASSSQQNALRVDSTPPAVTNLSLSTVVAKINESVNITLYANDPNLTSIKVGIKYPAGSTEFYDVLNATGSEYYYNFTNTSAYGRYDVTAYARDGAENINDTQKAWFITVKTSNASISPDDGNKIKIEMPSVDTELEIGTRTGTTGYIEISQSNELPPGTSSSFVIPSTGKYILINSSDSIKDNLTWAVIKSFYMQTEIERAGFQEDSLGMLWYNETGGIWEILNSSTMDWVYAAGVNTTGPGDYSGYVWANVSHFSYYGTGGVPSATPTAPATSTETQITGNSGGGGGGGGGGASGEDPKNIVIKEKYDLYIFKDKVTSYRFTSDLNPIMFINITGNISAGEVNAAVEVLRDTSSLVNIPVPGIVYKNANIWVGTYGFAVPRNIKEAVIKFRVENSWLSSNNIKSSDISMIKWDGGRWVQLETAELTEDSTFTYYETKTDSFSHFAITGLKSTAVPAVSTTISGTIPLSANTTSIGKQPSEMAPVNLSIIIVMFVLIGITGAVYLRKNKFKRRG